MKILGKHNQIIKDIRSLDKKKNREELGLYIIEGLTLIEEALEEDLELELVLAKKSLELEEDCFKGLDFYRLEDQVFNSLSKTVSPQGIMALARIKDYPLEDIRLGENYIFIDGLQDPGNLGTIIRSSEAFGFGGVILGPESVDAYNDKVIRSAAGSIFRVAIYKADYQDLVNLKEKGFSLVSTSLKGTSRLEDIEAENLIVTVGNEKRGVSKELEDLSDYLSKIEMSGRVESLNAGVAASLAMYIFRKKK